MMAGGLDEKQDGKQPGRKAARTGGSPRRTGGSQDGRQPVREAVKTGRHAAGTGGS